MGTTKQYKIIFSLIISLGLTLIITRTFFFAGVPKINSEKVKRITKNIKDNLTIFKNTFTYKISSKKIDYERIFDNVPAVEFTIPSQTPIQESTITPTIFPNINPSPSAILLPKTLTPRPTYPVNPSPTVIIIAKITPTIFKKPTMAPTLKPEPTFIPVSEPTFEPASNPLKIANPLDQPYYNPNLAYKCYNANKFIKVYANGISSANCYSKVQSFVSSNLTSVSILGKNISVHKKAYQAFKAVADDLEKSKAARAYIIKKIGAYVFRCNVNASTSGRNDLCSSGCVLSTHSFGIAVDINWDENCNGCSSYTMPEEIVDIFESYGFRWGGRYRSIFGSKIDSMHFEYMYDLCKDLN